MRKVNTKSKLVALAAMTVMLAMSICLSRVHANAAGRDRVLTVMTRNLDTGTDFGPIFSATTPLQLLTAVGEAYAEVQASNIPERAAGIAKEIEAKPAGPCGTPGSDHRAYRPLRWPSHNFSF